MGSRPKRTKQKKLKVRTMKIVPKKRKQNKEITTETTQKNKAKKEGIKIKDQTFKVKEKEIGAR